MNEPPTPIAEPGARALHAPRAFHTPCASFVAAVPVLALVACGGPTGEPRALPPIEVAPQPAPSASPAPAASASPASTAASARPEAAPEPVYLDANPYQDRTFPLEDATFGLAGSGPLVATITTSRGELSCRLFDDKAPVTVANFVGLARGTRPYKSRKGWVKAPAYDGTTFHRIIRGFMIQGGDPEGTGRGEPGYVIPDEMWGGKHDRPGLLCMANRGPNTNGMQFFITDAGAAYLDKTYTIFGECSPVSVVHAIAAVPTGPGDRPTAPVTIDRVTISRGAP
jgi:peptidyl-prolyl cis-trans isomerase A (cyclophilin A)